MSVISATKMWSRSGGNFTSDKYYTYANDIAITEAWMVEAQIGDSVATIEAYTGIPNYSDKHPDATAYVRKKTIEPLGPIFYIAILEYEGHVDATAIDVEWTDTSTSEPVDRDWSGNAITTVPGEQVDGISVEVADQVVVISRQFQTINTYAIAAYRRATNSDTYLGWPPGTARLVGFSAKNQFRYGAPQELWDVTARIQFRQPYANTTPAQAWYARWRHEGLYKCGVANDPTTFQRVRDQLNQEVSKPVLLKADGTQEYDPNNAVYFHTQLYGSLPYAGLGLL